MASIRGVSPSLIQCLYFCHRRTDVEESIAPSKHVAAESQPHHEGKFAPAPSPSVPFYIAKEGFLMLLWSMILSRI